MARNDRGQRKANEWLALWVVGVVAFYFAACFRPLAQSHWDKFWREVARVDVRSH